MWLKYIILTFLLLPLALNIKAQPPETIYQGNVIATGFIQGLPLASDGPFPVGFNFTFFGNTYSQFYIGVNGLVMFTDPDSQYNTETTIPSAATPNNFIAPFWDNLSVLDGGTIMYQTIGAAPTRKCIIQFRKMGFDPVPTALGTFSVILYETSNKIQIQYRLIVDPYSPNSHGASATIGLENSTGSAGVTFAYHNGSAVTTEDAISFSPSGGTYSTNPDEIYDGIFLTTNITQPDPGIVTLLTPALDAVIGSSQTFEWAAADNAAAYFFVLDTLSSLSTATFTNVGTDLSYSKTGLLLNKTYYWAVFSYNTTSTTWCEVKRFSTSSNPPLAAVPQTIWTEQGQDKTIRLSYTGGDAGAKTAIITALPAQGQLYQYNSGARGSQVTSVPSIVTDPLMNIIYAATGSSGNGAGNFNFKINDGTGDSPEATVTVNVSPPGVPSVLYTAKGTNSVEIQFDRLMADPAGKQNQFTVTVNGTPATLTTAALKSGDPYAIILTLSATLTGTETVLVSYTQGNISSTTGGLLFSFTDQTVSLRSQTITFTQSLTKKFNESPFSLTATSSSGLGLTYSSSNLGVATISGSTVTLKALGSSDITARQAGNATWAPAKFIRTMTVSKGDQTITFSSLPAKTYGDADFALTATASSGLAIIYISDNPAVATVTGNLVHITGAGTATITATQPGNTLWNAAPDVPGTLTVNKANQTLTFGSLPAKTFGDVDFTITATSSSGLPVSFTSDNPSVATVSGNIVHIVSAGSTVITASQPGNSNFNPATDVQQTLLVNKANQVINFNPQASKTYGDSDFTLTATSSSGLPVSFTSDNPAVATVSGNIVHIVSARSTLISASQAGDSNYNPAADVAQLLTVNKALLTITADDKSKEYNAALPSLTFTFAGFVLNEDQAVLDNLPTVQTTAIITSPVGTYPITLTGGSDNNYTYNLTDGSLTITRISQTITFTRVPEKLLVADTFRIIASSSSGLPLTFESIDESVATIAGDIVTGVTRGNAQVRAYNDGDNNYLPASNSVTFEVYSTHKDIMYLFTPNADVFNDYWELPELLSWGRCEVRVYNRWGKIVFTDDNYNNLWDGTYEGKPLPEGAYYFTIKTENAGFIKGTVNIVR